METKFGETRTFEKAYLLRLYDNAQNHFSIWLIKGAENFNASVFAGAISTARHTQDHNNRVPLFAPMKIFTVRGTVNSGRVFQNLACSFPVRFENHDLDLSDLDEKIELYKDTKNQEFLTKSSVIFIVPEEIFAREVEKREAYCALQDCRLDNQINLEAHSIR